MLKRDDLRHSARSFSKRCSRIGRRRAADPAPRARSAVVAPKCDRAPRRDLVEIAAGAPGAYERLAGGARTERTVCSSARNAKPAALPRLATKREASSPRVAARTNPIDHPRTGRVEGMARRVAKGHARGGNGAAPRRRHEPDFEAGGTQAPDHLAVPAGKERHPCRSSAVLNGPCSVNTHFGNARLAPSGLRGRERPGSAKGQRPVGASSQGGRPSGNTGAPRRPRRRSDGARRPAAVR